MLSTIGSACLMVACAVSLAAENSIANIHEDLVTRWCNSFAFGLIYSKEKYWNCSEREVPFVSMAQESMKGITIRVGILEGDADRDFDCGLDYVRGQWVEKEGYSNHILKLLQEVLEFEISYVPASNCSDSPNGKATTLLGLMRGNETDLTVCHWTVSDVVLESAENVVPTFKTTEAFVFVPSNLPLAQDVFLGTFSFELWIFFFLSILVLIVAFKFSTYMHWRVRPDHEPWTWDEVMLWAVATISQQSYSRHPRGSSCRTMFFMGYTISYLLYTGFAAGITSLLALNGHRSWLTFDDISTMKLQLVFYRDEYYYNLPGTHFKSVYFDKRFLHQRSDDLPGIFKRIKKTNSVGYGTVASFVNHMKKMDPITRETYLVFPIPLFHRQKSFLVRKSFPYKHLFNYWLIRFAERGFIDLGEKKFLKTPDVSKHRSNLWLSADLRNVFSAIVFLLGGWTLSIFIFCLEWICWRKTKRKKRLGKTKRFVK